MFKANLFNLAEKRLIKEKKLGIIPCYTELDVIEYALTIRKWLDKNNVNKAIKMTNAEKKRYKAKNNRERYLRNKKGERNA